MVILNLGKKQSKKKLHSGEGVRLGKYELGRILGEGNFGKVKFARNTDSGQPYAIKIIDKNKIIDLNITSQIKREICALKLLRHPNVVKLYEVFEISSSLYVVELRKCYGDASVYRQLCKKLLNDLGVPQGKH